MEQTVQAFDWHRMFIGDQPPLYLAEILFRTIAIYLYTLLLLRWLGSRTLGQLSSIEFLLVIALGSAVGDSMFYPEVPLLHAAAVITLVVLANKGLDILVSKSNRAEAVVDGKPVVAVEDGVISRVFLEGTSMTTGELFQQLRRSGIEDLGKVKAAYVETDGTLSVFEHETGVRGLPIVPPWEIVAPNILAAPSVADRGRSLACKRCGHPGTAVAGLVPEACPNCRCKDWVLLPVSSSGIDGARSVDQIPLP